MQQKAEPEIFDKAYTGMGGESGGVVGMLEVIESDFARLESDTKAAEVTNSPSASQWEGLGGEWGDTRDHGWRRE